MNSNTFNWYFLATNHGDSSKGARSILKIQLDDGCVLPPKDINVRLETENSAKKWSQEAREFKI